MKYRPMRFDPAYRPHTLPETIFIIPLAAEAQRCRVLSPGGLPRKLMDLAIQNKLRIRLFSACPEDVVRPVREELLRQCAEEPARYAARAGRLLLAGAGLAAVGLINWVLPDPVPLADELLLTGAGAALAWGGWVLRRRDLPLLRRKADLAAAGLHRLRPATDALLDAVYGAIRARTEQPRPQHRASGPGGWEHSDSEPDAPERAPVESGGSRPGRSQGGHGPVDPLEAEAAWLVEHLDLEGALDAGRFELQELRSLLAALEDVLPLRRIAELETAARRPSGRRPRQQRRTLAERLGLSADAFTVYAELYRRAQELLADY